jgi:hypothetical protein
LSYVRSGDWSLVVSPVHDAEIGAIDDLTEREHLLSILRQMGQRVTFDLRLIRKRAEQLLGKDLAQRMLRIWRLLNSRKQILSRATIAYFADVGVFELTFGWAHL